MSELPKSPFVFLCHAQADSTIIERLRTDLHTQGIVTWTSTDPVGIKPGTSDWEEAVRNAIRQAHAVVLIVSPNSRQSRYVKDELRIATIYNLPIFPFWIAGEHLKEPLPLGLSSYHYVDARGKHYEEAIHVIVIMLRQLLVNPSEFTDIPVDKEIPRRHLRIFLCQASEDKPYVRQLYQRLKACNVHPWLDEEDLLPGQNWEHEIRKAVRDSDVVIICLSRLSISKTGFVQKEIKFALDVTDEQTEDTIFLIPLKLEECTVPQRLSHLHWVNLFEENGFNKLMSALKMRAVTLDVVQPLSG